MSDGIDEERVVSGQTKNALYIKDSVVLWECCELELKQGLSTTVLALII